MSTNSKLRELANNLPPRQELSAAGVPLYNQVVVLGSTILSHNPKAVDLQNNPIRADKRYVSNRPRLVDHFKKLKAAFELEGAAGVQRYVDAITNNVEPNPTPANETA